MTACNDNTQTQETLTQALDRVHHHVWQGHLKHQELIKDLIENPQMKKDEISKRNEEASQALLQGLKAIEALMNEQRKG